MRERERERERERVDQRDMGGRREIEDGLLVHH